MHNSGINDIFTILNSAWPVSLGGTGGTTSITSWDAITAKGTDIASASTIVLTTATGPRIDITGTTSITAVTLANGSMRIARATGIFVLTASATLIVNKSTTVNYTTAVGDLMIFTAEGGVISVTVIGSSSSSASGMSPPQGRITLTTAVPVLTADVTGATTVYYTQDRGQTAPIYNGTVLVMVDLGGELSQTTTDSTKSPAACIQDSAYDLFLWLDGVTPRCTRGPVWTVASTVTITNASPGVISWTAHGLHEGSPVVFTTTGGLPTGLTAGTTYYVSKTGLTANAFSVSTSKANATAGTNVNTSSAGSGTHTATNHDSVRGTGAGTTELEVFKGIKVNKIAITNGPAARMGTYIGSIITNASSSIDVKFGTLAANGGEAWIGIDNAYNRHLGAATIRDSTDSWTYSAGVWRSANASATMRLSLIRGLNEDAVIATYHAIANAGGGQNGAVGVGLDTTAAPSGVFPITSLSGSIVPMTVSYGGLPGIGAHHVDAVEFSSGATLTFYGDVGVAYAQSGMTASFWW